VDEPLAVEQRRRLLQQRNPSTIVLDQFVISREEVGDLFLHNDRQCRYRHTLND
jgi:hypothetical protein